MVMVSFGHWEFSSKPHPGSTPWIYTLALHPGSRTSLHDLVHHANIAIGLLQFGSTDPDLTVCGNVLSGLVQDLPGIVVRLQTSQGKPQLPTGETQETVLLVVTEHGGQGSATH